MKMKFDMAKCVCGHRDNEHNSETRTNCNKCTCPRFKKNPFF